MHDLPVLYLYIQLTHRLERGFKLAELLFVSQTQRSTKEKWKHPRHKLIKRKKSEEAWLLKIRPTKASTRAVHVCTASVCVCIWLRTLTTWVCRDVFRLKWCWTVWMWESCTETSMKKSGSEAEKHLCQHSSLSHIHIRKPDKPT